MVTFNFRSLNDIGHAVSKLFSKRNKITTRHWSLDLNCHTDFKIPTKNITNLLKALSKIYSSFIVCHIITFTSPLKPYRIFLIEQVLSTTLNNYRYVDLPSKNDWIFSISQISTVIKCIHLFYTKYPLQRLCVGLRHISLVKRVVKITQKSIYESVIKLRVLFLSKLSVFSSCAIYSDTHCTLLIAIITIVSM